MILPDKNRGMDVVVEIDEEAFEREAEEEPQPQFRFSFSFSYLFFFFLSDLFLVH